jgi:VPDSG-CTERM motif
VVQWVLPVRENHYVGIPYRNRCTRIAPKIKAISLKFTSICPLWSKSACCEFFYGLAPPMLLLGTEFACRGDNQTGKTSASKPDITMHSFLKSSLILGGALCVSSIGWADSLSPSSYSATLGVGESVTITKTVTVSAGTPTSSKVDVFFLADETGSMGGTISAVRTGASSILAGAAGLGDVAFGVGGYRDVGDSFVYRKIQDITTSQATAQTGINSWVASGGGDWEEAEIYALKQVADTTTWRAGSKRLAIWFGDAPGHDPSGTTGTTEAQAIAALNAQGISVLAIDVGSMNSYGQATRIASATGGQYYNGINTSTIVSTINAAITKAVETYSSVGLDLSGVPDGVSVTAIPTSITGSFDRSIDRTFNFSVTFSGVTPGDYSFDIYGTVDGGRVATESDRISVGGSSVPDGGSSLTLLGLALFGIALVRRKLG